MQRPLPSDAGSSPKDSDDYAIAYLAHKKFPPAAGAISFWTSPTVIAAIKPKYVEYLQVIAYRLKILKETPRNKFKDTISKTVQEGLFKDLDTKLHFFFPT